jgi:hypothetical protein
MNKDKLRRIIRTAQVPIFPFIQTLAYRDGLEFKTWVQVDNSDLLVYHTRRCWYLRDKKEQVIGIEMKEFITDCEKTAEHYMIPEEGEFDYDREAIFDDEYKGVDFNAVGGYNSPM